MGRVQVTNKPRFPLGCLATRAAFAHPYTTAAAQAPPSDAPTLSTRSPSSESPFKTLTSDQKPRFFHPLAAYSKYSLEVMVNSDHVAAQLLAWAQSASSNGQLLNPIRCHVMLNTGMSRMGLGPWRKAP